MTVKSQIECPDCQSPIYMESTLLLAGHSFKCSNPNCGTTISLSLSETEKVSKAFQKFEKIREDAISQAKDVSDF